MSEPTPLISPHQTANQGAAGFSPRGSSSSTTRLILLAGLLTLLLLTIWFTPRLSAIRHDPDQLPMIMEQLRKPRLHLAMIAGAGLALSGMIFQALFRNPLAEPFTLGISSGASLAIVLGLALGLHPAWLGGIGMMVLALIGALAVVMMVYGLAQLRRDRSTATLLLAGVCINFICGAGIVLMQYFMRQYELQAVIYWLIGSVDVIGPGRIRLLVALVVGAGAVALWLMHRSLDLLMMGEQLAASRGVNVALTRALSYFIASTMTAMIVALCGPIAFVGLLVPHTMRSLIGPSHRWLLPACLLFGMSLLPICDCLARNLLGWYSSSHALELPVGVVTNVLGGFFFLIVLIRQRNDRPLLA
ncbi:MAG: Hemin transport system permease protein HmuU [Phycisphaerae bacterium]|nr:Hemin transport system permease protein HmuU [Phycisphaerae bacterium]